MKTLQQYCHILVFFDPVFIIIVFITYVYIFTVYNQLMELREISHTQRDNNDRFKFAVPTLRICNFYFVFSSAKFPDVSYESGFF